MENTKDFILNSLSPSSVMFSGRNCGISSYGHRGKDYRKIVRKVVYEREVRDAIAALQQRLNMLELMREDAQELKQKLSTSKTKLYVESLMSHFVPIIVVLFSLVLVLYAGQWVLYVKKWK